MDAFGMLELWTAAMTLHEGGWELYARGVWDSAHSETPRWSLTLWHPGCGKRHVEEGDDLETVIRQIRPLVELALVGELELANDEG